MRDRIEKILRDEGYPIDDYFERLLDGLDLKTKEFATRSIGDDLFSSLSSNLESYGKKTLTENLEDLESLVMDYQQKKNMILSEDKDSYYPHELALELNEGVDNEAGNIHLPSMPRIEQATNNLSSGYYIFYAEPNVGKSALSISIGAEALDKNPNSAVLYFSMDDPQRDIVRRFISAIAANRWEEKHGGTRQKDETYIKINDVSKKLTSPYFTDDNKYGEMAEARRQDAIAKFIRLTAPDSRRLYIYDALGVRNFSEIRKIIRDKKRKHENLIVCLDAVLRVPVKGNNEFEKNEMRADTVDFIANEFKVPLLTTAELTKDKDRKGLPTLAGIKGTSRFGYNAKFALALAMNDSEKFDSGEDYKVLGYITKNKLSSGKGDVGFEFLPFSSRYKEIDEEYSYGI
jgi:hypothetical protein